MREERWSKPPAGCIIRCRCGFEARGLTYQESGQVLDRHIAADCTEPFPGAIDDAPAGVGT